MLWRSVGSGIWVGKNKVAPSEPDEVEMLLGCPRNFTRGGVGPIGTNHLGIRFR